MNEWNDENDYTLVFDHFYTNNHIQILKSLLPFFDTDVPSYLPVMIKYLELQHTIELTKKGLQPAEPCIQAASKQAPNLEEVYKAIRKYLAPNEDKNIQQLMEMLHTMENIKEMQKMMEFFQSMNGDDNTSSNPFPDLSNLENMMGNGFNMGDFMQLMNTMNH